MLDEGISNENNTVHTFGNSHEKGSYKHNDETNRKKNEEIAETVDIILFSKCYWCWKKVERMKEKLYSKIEVTCSISYSGGAGFEYLSILYSS